MARTKDFDENEVLTRAMNIFWSRGYQATSMEDLVSGLGISRSSLYGTYTDKHTLFLKALENYQEISAARIMEVLNQPGSAKETIAKLIGIATDGLRDGKQKKGCFILNASVEVGPHDKTVNKMVCQNDQRMEEIFYQIILKGKKSGEIRNPQPAKTLAKFLFNMMKGLQVAAKSSADGSDFQDMITMAVSILDQRN
jgi:TetR/AcrR family transcriptional regulator, transcriptional repressor for nem operon